MCVVCGYHKQYGRPKTLVVEESPGKLKITRNSHSIFWMTTVFVVTASLTAPIAGNSGWIYWFLFFCVVVPAVLAVNFYDRRSVVIEVDKQQMSIYKIGRLPSLTRRKVFPVDDILQVFVFQKTRHDAWIGHHDHATTTYRLFAVRKNGWRRLLGIYASAADALIAEEQIERFLSAKDIVVKPTWYQRWLNNEETMDACDRDSEAMYAKSIPFNYSILLLIGLLFPLSIPFLLFFLLSLLRCLLWFVDG